MRFVVIHQAQFRVTFVAMCIAMPPDSDITVLCDPDAMDITPDPYDSDACT